MMKSKLSSGLVYAVALFSFMALALLLSQSYRFEEHVITNPVPLTGFEKTKQASFHAVETSNGFHQFSVDFALTPNTEYHVQYDISLLPRAKVIVTTDFQAPGYDKPEQEISKIYGMDVLKQRQSFTFNSRKSPERALLRISYTGPPGLEIANIQIQRIPTWFTWLKRGVIFTSICMLLIVALLVARRFRYAIAILHQGESPLRMFVEEAPLVLAIYFLAVLIRYTVYILMPYSSGDEYVYKSIAAGIWQFGQTGTLTDDMISNSVNLPNLLYPYLIAPAFALEGNFYYGIRLINAIVINLAIFPCYLIARQLLDRKLAILASTLSISIPFINLGAFAVTEVLFLPLFLFSIWVAIESINRPNSIKLIAAFGVMVATLFNVRLNALVLLPAYFTSILWISLRRRQVVLLFKRPYWLVAIPAFICAHILLQYLAGVQKIGDLGFYGQVAEKSKGPFAIIINDLLGFFHLIVGHMTTVGIPYALPIALIFALLISNKNILSGDNKVEAFLILSVVSASALFVLGIIFTISVSPNDLGGLGRWHSRYYFYFYPLLIIAGVVVSTKFQTYRKIARHAVATTVGILLVANIYFIWFHGGAQLPWFGSNADNMDVQWYKSARGFYWFFITCNILLTWLWCCRPHYFLRAFTSFVILWTLVANYGVIKLAGLNNGVRLAPCGSFAQYFIDHYPSRFVVVGDSRFTMIDTAFWIPFAPEKSFIHSDISKTLMPTEVSVETDYLVVNGKIHVDPAYEKINSIGQCSIYRIRQ